MKKFMRFSVSLSIALLAVFLIGAPAGCQDEPQPDTRSNKKIVAINVRNNKAISAETVISKIKTKVGDLFVQESLNEDLKRLYATEYFMDVAIDVEDSEDGVAVTFIVDEKPVIEDIVFKGNNAFRAQKLKSMMKSKPNEMLNPVLLTQDMNEIKDFYVKKGYPLADVQYSVDLDKDSNKARITVTVDEKVRVKVSKVVINGNKAVSTKNITRILGTKPAWLFNQGIFKEDVFQDDIEKIKSLYDDIGYLDVEVVPELNYSQDGTQLEIVLNIDEGKQYLVGTLTVKGNLVFKEKEVMSKITMVSGKPFSAKTLRRDVGELRQLYFNHGYMNVIIDVERNLNTETGKIDVIYIVDPKEPVYVGKIEIRGNLKTKDVVIRRELRIYPGERFDGNKLRRSKERLYNLGFFENVAFDTEPTEEPNIQNLVVTVKETKTGEFSFGGGYSSIDLLVGFVEISQRNFDIMNFPTFMGGGQRLAIKAEIGMVRSNYNIGWTDPWIFGLPYSFGFDFYRVTHSKSGDVGWIYDETRWGGDLKLGKEFTDYLKGSAIYRLEEINISNLIDNASRDLRNEEGTNWISSILAELVFDTRDNVFSPTRGYVVMGSIENAGGFIGGNKNFVRGTASAVYYQPFFEKLVLEAKCRMGLSSPYGSSDEIPVYERFYAGGANTIRGYRERKVSPRDPDSNEPIGGEAILIGNLELTFPIYEKLIKGAVFYDIGNVWRKAGDFINEGKLRSGTGVGVRVNTPLGPVRVDYGYPLVKNFDDERTGEVYFSMSRGF